MAGDWIPFTKELPRKREVGIIIDQTGLSRREVICMLMEFWIWCDSETTDGLLAGLTIRSLSALHADIEQTFFRSLSAVGWLVESADGVHIPHFDRWMGRSAKRRLRESLRKQDNRNQNRANVPLLSASASASHADQMRPTEQYSTEQKENTLPTLPREGLDAVRKLLVEGIKSPAKVAAEFQRQVAQVFEAAGWRADWERPVADRGDGRQGRVDLHLRSPRGVVVAIELDRLSPRQKSITKLLEASADFRLVLLREGSGGGAPAGIDAIIGFGVAIAVPPSLATPEFLAAWDRWQEYRRQRKPALTDIGREQQLKKLAEVGPVEAVRFIDRSITNGWQGLFFAEDRNGRSGQHVGPSSRVHAPPGKYANLDDTGLFQPRPPEGADGATPPEVASGGPPR